MTTPIKSPAANGHRRRWAWHFTVRGLFVLTLSVALGLSVWKIEKSWYQGIWAAVSLWIVLGLAAQARDLGAGFRGSEGLTREDRWGRRFAIAWRLAVAGLIGVCFLVRALISCKILVLDESRDFVWVSAGDAWNAVLLLSMTAAIASSPRLARKSKRREWSWVVSLLSGLVAGALCAFLLVDRLVIALLVHLSIEGIQMAQPLLLAPEVLETYAPQRTLLLFDAATAGVVTVLTSCGVLRWISQRWQQGRTRKVLGVLLAVSLTAPALLASWIALVGIPMVTPVVAQHFIMPQPPKLAAGLILAVFLVTAAARRWSESPQVESSAPRESWRRDEGRYYHERPFPVLISGGLILAEGVHHSLNWGSTFGRIFYWDVVVEIMMTSATGLIFLAPILLAAQGLFSGWWRRMDPARLQLQRLDPGLFLLNWLGFAAILTFGLPILGAWGFAFLLRRVLPLWPI